MGKFNPKQSENKTLDANLAGGPSYKRRDIRKEIVSIILNSILKNDSFYESEEDRIDKIFELVEKNPEQSKFLAKTMIFARNECNLRSVSHVLGIALVENAKGTSFMRTALNKTLLRPDDATEMVSLFNSRNCKKMIPNVLRRSIKDSLENKWDEYQLKKYAGSKNKVKLKNLIQISHPSPKKLVESGKAKSDDIFARVIEDSLLGVQTAQTINAGFTNSQRAEAYKSMLIEKKLGYMAALKNIKNILESGADQETIDKLCELLINEKIIRKSKVLPFRFTQAYSMIDKLEMDKFKLRQILDAIEQGFKISAGNVPIVEDDEKIALLLDESDSMNGLEYDECSIATNSPFAIGKTLMASLLTGLKIENAVGYLWADNAREVTLTDKPFDFIKNTHTNGGGTDIIAPLGKLISTRTFVDKIVILSDMEMYGGYINIGNDISTYIDQYKTKVNPDVKVLFWNLEGYGEAPIEFTDDILEISGYSDVFLKLIPKMWQSKDALIDEIESINI